MRYQKLAILGTLVVSLLGCTENQTKNLVQKAVADQMKDPVSTQFRNVVMDGRKVCGEVNAKNSYGAYGGFTKFVAFASDGNQVSVHMEPDSRELMAVYIARGHKAGIAWLLARDKAWLADYESCQSVKDAPEKREQLERAASSARSEADQAESSAFPDA